MQTLNTHRIEASYNQNNYRPMLTRPLCGDSGRRGTQSRPKSKEQKRIYNPRRLKLKSSQSGKGNRRLKN